MYRTLSTTIDRPFGVLASPFERANASAVESTVVRSIPFHIAAIPMNVQRCSSPASRVLLAGLLALPLLLTAGCGSSMRVTHGYDETADFSAYHTFDWLAQPDDLDDPLVGAPELSFRIKRTVEAQLAEKGYEKVEADADFYVVAHAALQRRITRTYIDRWGYYYPRRRPGRWVPVVEVYDVGTLLIDVIDAGTDELVWRGTATDVVRGDPNDVREQADEAVRRILASFPQRRDLASRR